MQYHNNYHTIVVSYRSMEMEVPSLEFLQKSTDIGSMYVYIYLDLPLLLKFQVRIISGTITNFMYDW